MQKIKKLPLTEIQKVAAGQVIERPANVVKELIENALDARATKISVYIEQAGQTLIRVVDNGCGMSPDDAVVCFERHATSKITNFDQLQTLGTFGFRGEALYALSAVSTVTLITKEADVDQGTCIVIQDGSLIDTTRVSSVTGTDIAVKNIFANVPVRKKFLKKEETEWRAVQQQFQAFCCSYLDVHFQLFSENKMVANCPPVLSFMDRCAQLWDTNLASNLIDLPQDDTASIKISGVISHQNFYRYNRNFMFFFINKRWVKNYTLSQAVMKGYRNVLVQGRYPIALIALDLAPQLVDVNVHPRKEEVAFVDPKQVETIISSSISRCLADYLSQQLQKNSYKNDQQPFLTYPSYKEPYSVQPLRAMESISPRASEINMHTQEIFQIDDLPTHVQAPLPILSVETEHQEVVFDEHQFDVIAVIKKTYILVDHPEGIVFVDQHAAHERILFEQFSKKFHEVSSISLLFPEIVQLLPDEVAMIMEQSIVLHEHGIVFDQYSPNQIIIQAVPAYLKAANWTLFIREIIDIFVEHAALEKDDFFKRVHQTLQASMACKAAVKAGDTLTDQQIKQLLHDLHQCENKFLCPHGRPTSWLLPLYEIEKKFKRKK